MDKKEKNYFDEVSQIESTVKIEYREMCKTSNHKWVDSGEKAYIYSYMTAKLAQCLRDIDKLKSQIK